MSTPAPAHGYQPGIHMPIIAPPPTGTSPQPYYNSLLANTALSVVPNAGGTAIDITMSNPATAPLFAVTGGSVSFVPAGQRLPGTAGGTSPGAGSLVLRCWAVDVTHLKKILPPGAPPPIIVLYLNVDSTSVRTALTPILKTNRLSVAYLLQVWQGTRLSTTADRDQLEMNFLDQLLLGRAELFVVPGTLLGHAGLSVPGNPTADRKVTVRFLNAGEDDLSPIVHLRAMPSYGGAQWTGHPLSTGLMSAPVPVDFYLQFEVWNQTTQRFETLPANVPVDLVDYNAVLPNKVLTTEMTDAQGRVHFRFADAANLESLAGEPPDIFFRARPGGSTLAGQVLPAEWSTKGWKATDGTQGYFENFSGTQVGDAATPVVFRIGLDFHVELRYRDGSGSDQLAPTGIPISIHATEKEPTNSDLPKKKMRTDARGQVHGVIFDVKGGDNVYFHIDFEIEDAGINLPTASVDMSQSGWNTFSNDPDKNNKSQTYWPDNESTSLGGPANPLIFLCTAEGRNVALFFLKCLRELSVFLWHLTKGDWKGVSNLVIYTDVPLGVVSPYSWPLGTVRIHPSWHWKREVLIHELTHQVVWKQADYSTLGIFWEGAVGELALFHYKNLYFNSEQGLMEGWPEFIQAIFTQPPPPTSLPTATGYPLGSNYPFEFTGFINRDRTPYTGPVVKNWGEIVEGAFANGMWELFHTHVIQSGQSAVPPSNTGDVTKKAAWLTNPAVQDRFCRMIWEPLKKMSGNANPTTTDYLKEVELRNTADWPALKVTLNKHHMAT